MAWRSLDALLNGGVTAIEALGVDPQQHLHRLPRPLGCLDRRHSTARTPLIMELAAVKVIVFTANLMINGTGRGRRFEPSTRPKSLAGDKAEQAIEYLTRIPGPWHPSSGAGPVEAAVVGAARG
ncbi:hypothetical protein [Micromonospora sp. NPDC047074]|uniref:hypothetical protein n=1 Tax=Micromonospora sp. NPDC047074 TaxID=3154339 RepID=UPI0033D9313A